PTPRPPARATSRAWQTDRRTCPDRSWGRRGRRGPDRVCPRPFQAVGDDRRPRFEMHAIGPAGDLYVIDAIAQHGDGDAIAAGIVDRGTRFRGVFRVGMMRQRPRRTTRQDDTQARSLAVRRGVELLD